MLALIIIANPGSSSFSHAMAKVAEDILYAKGYEVARHDLYAEGFDPVQPTGEGDDTAPADASVEQHCAELSHADLILVFHPNWWGQPPSILKGWIDRVFRLNTAYGYLPGEGFEGVPIGLLRAKQALIFNTSNTPAEREAEVFGDPLDLIWRRCVFGLCGVQHVNRRMFTPICTSSQAQREAWLSEVASLVHSAT